MAENERVEQAEVDAYIQADGALADADRLEYLKTRYEQVKMEYRNLQLNREEIEALKRDDLKGRVSEQFAQNYKARKWVVTELRKRGIAVDDKFVPG